MADGAKVVAEHGEKWIHPEYMKGAELILGAEFTTTAIIRTVDKYLDFLSGGGGHLVESHFFACLNLSVVM